MREGQPLELQHLCLIVGRHETSSTLRRTMYGIQNGMELVMAHEMSSTRRGAAGVRLQHRQMLRLPRKVTLQHHQMPCLPGQVTLHHEMVRLPRKSQYFFLTEIAWSVAHTEPDDSIMIGDWSELIWSWNCSHNEPVRLHEFLFPLGNAFCMEKLIRSCSSYLPVTAGLHQQLLRLPREVTFQHHQVLRLPRKVTLLQHHEMLRLPGKVTVQPHTKSFACQEKWRWWCCDVVWWDVMWCGEIWCEMWCDVVVLTRGSSELSQLNFRCFFLWLYVCAVFSNMHGLYFHLYMYMYW